MCRPAPYDNLLTRLVANTVRGDTEQSCWLWKGRKICRYGYGRFSVRVAAKPHPVSLSAHVAIWLLYELGSDMSAEELWWACFTLRLSKLELDHLCTTPGCINPDHLELVTHAENCQRKYHR